MLATQFSKPPIYVFTLSGNMVTCNFSCFKL